MITNETDVVIDFIAAINRHNPSEISALMTDDHTVFDSRGKIESGLAKMDVGWKEYFRMFAEYFTQVEDIVQNGEFVAVFGLASGTYNGKRGLVPENKIEMSAAWRAVVQNGKVKYWQVYADWTDGIRIISEDEAMV